MRVKIPLTNSQADVQIVADQLSNLGLDPKPSYLTLCGIEVYENDYWMVKVDWKNNTMIVASRGEV